MSVDSTVPSAPRGCLAQAVATYDFVRLVRRTDGSVWKAAQGPSFERVGGADFKATDIAASGSSAYSNAIGCALVSGEVWCFTLAGPLGSPSDLGTGAAGDATTDQPQRVVLAPDDVLAPGAPLTDVVQLSGGQNGGGASFCAVTKAGLIFCWGYSVNGLLGPNRDEHTDHAVRLSADNATATPTGAKEVRVGYSASCARFEDGSVSCWGDDTYGEIGFPPEELGDAPASNIPITPVHLGKNALRLAASPGTTHCAILEDHTVSCWGRNHWGQAGAPDTEPHVKPTTVLVSEGGSALAGVIDLAPDTGMEAMCANVKRVGLWCWGHAFAAGPDRAPTGPYAAPAYATKLGFVDIALPLSSYGATNGSLVFIDAQGRLVLGAGKMPAAIQPTCD